MSRREAAALPAPAADGPAGLTFRFQQKGHLPFTTPSFYTSVEYFAATAFRPRKNPRARDTMIRILTRFLFMTRFPALRISA
jgi:hypothetical protein